MKKIFSALLLIGFLATLVAFSTSRLGNQVLSGNFEYTGSVAFDGPVTFDAAVETGSFVLDNDSATAGYVLTSDASGAGDWARPYITYKRANPGAPVAFTPIVVTRTLTTAGGSGKAIDTLTVQGTAAGTALFSTITDIQATAYSSDTTKTYNVNVFDIGTGNKTITVRASYRLMADTTGLSNKPAASGTTIYLTVKGY